ncbi:hypothetical protein [uncultured Bifidobacterium sp.]|uniref:DUF7657 domain-containing protein n=1 Tax=uncultured Bifidobacterium sp. TaxID=165187 RepID=UPI00259496C0|nr:hypothetical protein [uncultured Bifidobacterium sp.]
MSSRLSALRVDGLIHRIGVLIIAVLAAAYLEIFLEVAHEDRTHLPSGFFYGHGQPEHALRLVVLIAVAALTLYVLNFHARRFLHAIHTYRWWIGCSLIIIFTLLRISGSSVAFISNHIGGDPYKGTLFGIPRSIRSDEWSVFTPLAFSQAYSGYSRVSSIPEASSIDMTMVYGQPAWALATFFRPFLWGFMLFGSDRGLAFFWCARLAVLLLVSYEFGRWLTKDNRQFAAAYGVLIGLAPIVQWWFAINGTAEVLIFGQAAVLLFRRYLHSNSTLYIWLLAMATIYCLGGFLLVLYPPLQIPLAYVYGLLVIWLIICRHRDVRLPNRSLLSMIVPMTVAFAALIACILMVIYTSRQAILMESSTVYPGSRISHGQGLLECLMDYTANLFMPLEEHQVIPNAPERAVFFSLFPIGLILSIWTLLKKRDGLIILLFVCDLIFMIYGLFGFPDWLCRITLMGRTTTGRVKFGLGFIDLILLFRSLSLLYNDADDEASLVAPEKDSVKIRLLRNVALAVVLAALLTGATILSPVYPLRKAYLIFLMLLLTIILLAVFEWLSGRGYASRMFLSSILIVALAGFCVNPIQQGSQSIREGPFVDMALKEVSRINNSADGRPTVFITDDSIHGQALIANGIPTVNSVNIYPQLQRWHIIDSQRTSEWIYNRYAYVNIDFTNTGRPTFKLAAPDRMIVTIPVKDLHKIGVTHVLTGRDLTEFVGGHRFLRRIETKEHLNLYEVEVN